MTAMHTTGRPPLPPPPVKQCEYCGSDYTMGGEGRARYAQRRYCGKSCTNSAHNATQLGHTKRATLPIVNAHVTDPHWRDRAACRNEDPEIFFASTRTDEDRHARIIARTICHRCPVTTDCLTWARAAEVDGIWGGTTRAQRAAL